MEADGGTSLAECPQCQDVVDHIIIKRKKRGLGEDILVKCEGCKAVHTIIIRPPRASSINATLSDGRESFNEEIEVDKDEEISVKKLTDILNVGYKI